LEDAESRPGSVELQVALPRAFETRAAVPVKITTSPGNSQYERELHMQGLDPKLFPQFRGMIALVHTFANTCDLRLDGKYRPPLGRAGHVLDSTLLRNAARSSLEGFMHRIAATIEERMRLPL
jgi:hypothetical protein